MKMNEKDLILILERIEDAYSHILLLVKQERDMLVRNEEAELEKNLSKQNDIIEFMRSEDHKRAQAVEDIIENRSIAYSPEITLKDLCKELKIEDAVEINDISEKIKEHIVNISSINKNNAYLIAQGRANIKGFVDLLLKKDMPMIYSKNGLIDKKPKMSKSLINKVI